MRQSFCIISEDLSSHIVEEIKGFAHSLMRSWSLDTCGIRTSPSQLNKPRGGGQR